MTTLDDVRRSYRAAFLRYLARGDEAPLHSGYELGRAAVAGGINVLQLAHVHHEILIEALESTREADVTAVATAASEFLLEVLAPYDMTQRGFRESG